MTSKPYNPSLRQYPRSSPAQVLPSSGEPSILMWLDSIGRLRPREDAVASGFEPDNEEINDLMGNENYDDDDEISVDDDD